MAVFGFYLEYDGKKTLSNPYERPADSIHSDSFIGAVNKFAASNRLKAIGQDVLDTGDYRAFFESRAFLRKSRELIYYIKPEGDETVSTRRYSGENR